MPGPSVEERVGVVEEKTRNIIEKVDDLKVDVRDMHDCLDRTRDQLDRKLDDMLVEYRTNRDNYYAAMKESDKVNQEAHASMMAKIEAFEKFKTKGTYIAIGVAAFLVGTGYLTHGEVGKIISMLPK